MKLKKLGVTLMSAALVVGCLAGCGGGNSSSSGDTSASGSSGASSDSGDDGEIKEITWMYAQMSGMIPADLQKVEDAVNELTEAEIGVHVKLNPVAFSDYSNQVSLIMASQEKMDIITTAGSNIWATLLNQNQLLSLNDLLDEYGQDIKNTIPEEYWDGTTVNGEIYALTTNGTKATTWGLQLRKDIIDKYDLKGELDKITMEDDVLDMDEDFEILTNIFQTVKENEPDMEILYPWAVDVAVNHDSLSDELGVLMGGDDKITNLYTSESYKKICQVMYDWNQAGYIMKDAATTTESAGSLLSSGRLFAYTINSGQDNYVGETNGVEFYSVDLKKPTIDTAEITKFAYCIPVTSTEPEAAMKFLNMLYTNEELVNLMAYGIEGEHYVTEDNGNIAYPEGVTAANSPYPADQNYMYGNMWLLKMHEPVTLTMDQMRAFTEEATPVSCLGFSYDPTNVKTEVAACSSVLEEYCDGLEKGQLDPQTTLPEFIEKLENSGINNIIAEKQSQYDAWLATQTSAE